MLKPVHISDKYNHFFGDLDNNTRCYVAPERFDPACHRAAQSMDIFSVGCVITEILNGGKPLFNIGKVKLCRDSGFSATKELQSFGLKPVYVELISEMVHCDPEKRPTAIECFKKWNSRVFPECFGRLLYHVGAKFQSVSHMYSDQKVSQIRLSIG